MDGDGDLEIVPNTPGALLFAHGSPGIGAGLGIHFAVADLRGTGSLDIAASCKDGLHVFVNEGM